MKKPWSISTTIRNPERIRDFLKILALMEGEEWTRTNQKKFQVLLIQYKVYGYGEPQFYSDLSPENLRLMDSAEPITYAQAERILDAKNYVGGGDMRGRQSFNPIEKMGLVSLDDRNRIRISSFGRYFLQENYDLGNIFFRSFLKWQLPNPESEDFRESNGYSIKPFVATLHLIRKVNALWRSRGENPVGITKQEFAIFIPTLINFESIGGTAQKVIDFRLAKAAANDQARFTSQYHRNYIANFLGSEDRRLIDATVSNTLEYADNIIRYFRLTRYLYIRGGGFYIDLEPRRMIEIESLLDSDDASPRPFASVAEYVAYITDINQPVLSWETEVKLREIVGFLTDDINRIISDLQSRSIAAPPFAFREIASMNARDLNTYTDNLREFRRALQELDIHFKSQDIQKIREYISALQNIHNAANKKSVELEKLVALALNALNDALRIKPNYPVGDDNEPTFTAPANKPDIECFYETFNSVCEVTMLTDRSQWYNEGQPVMRHIRDFEEANPNKNTYGVFVAPRLHQDTIETFWVAIKHGYRGAQQKVVPLSITQLVKLLEILVELKEADKKLTHADLSDLYNKIVAVTDEVVDSAKWVDQIPTTIRTWEQGLLAR